MITQLPIQHDFDTPRILKALIPAHRDLAELKGLCLSLPNQAVLINTLTLQEAKDSSAIENIITTHSDIYTAIADSESFVTASTKEVISYAEALATGFSLFTKNEILSANTVVEIQEVLEHNSAGFRKLPGTALINDKTNEIVYTPPEPQEVPELIDNFLKFFNDDSAWDADPLIKMAILHYQFESIHPFYDGNGRTGRILNIIYLVHARLIDCPVLYLSRYINLNKGLYYKYLQALRTENTQESWENYILYMLDGISRTSRITSKLITDIRELMYRYKHIIRENFPQLYSQDLINCLFSYPYTKISILENKIGVSYLTARKYLDILVGAGILVKQKIGKTNFYINVSLMDLLANIDSEMLICSDNK